MADKTIPQLAALSSALGPTDLFEVAKNQGASTYTSERPSVQDIANVILQHAHLSSVAPDGSFHCLFVIDLDTGWFWKNSGTLASPTWGV